MTPTQAAPLFSLLGNERRLRVLLALRECPGGASASILSPILDIPEPQLSDLLADMRKQKLVFRGRASRLVLYIQNQDLLNQLAELITRE